MENTSMLGYQRKRVPKRSYLDFGVTTLSAREDAESKVKKRQRKDEKRFVVDKVDGFTFISALMLNDFDEYEKNPVKHPLAPTKRKSMSKIESTAVKKKPKKPIQFIAEKSKSVPAKVERNFTPVKELSCSGKSVGKTVWDECKKKSVSPLSKSALVRLKQINVNRLNKNNILDKRKIIQDVSKNEKNNSAGKMKKSIGLKVPLMKINCAKSSNSASMKSKISPMPADICRADSFKKINETASPGLTDSEDSLDVCNIDEASSSQFIFNSLNLPEKKDRTATKPKSEENSKPTKKPCRVCCLYPCRIVAAKKLKSTGDKFPSFDITFVSRCQVHTAGEIVVGEPYKGKVNVNIQTTWTDIKMHVEFAKRFPYRAISVASCQPSLDSYDSKVLNSIPVVTQRCSESHRLLEQKRREELHTFYSKLADTLSMSKSILGNRASKQAILDTAVQEIKSLHDKHQCLTQEFDEVTSENVKKEKRWEELAGKTYPKPDESPAKKESKSKLLELYYKYMNERYHLKKNADKESVVDSKNQVSTTNTRKEGRCDGKKDVQGYAGNVCQANISSSAETESSKTFVIAASSKASLEMANNTSVAASPMSVNATNCKKQIPIGSSLAASVTREGFTRMSIQSSLLKVVNDSPVNVNATDCKKQTPLGSSQATSVTKEAFASLPIQSGSLKTVNDTPVTASPVSASATNHKKQIPVGANQAAPVTKESFASKSVQPSTVKSVNNTQVTASPVALLTNSKQSIPIRSSKTKLCSSSSPLHHIVDILRSKPVSLKVTRTSGLKVSNVPKIDLTSESQTLTATAKQLENQQNQAEAVKSNPLTQLHQLVRSPLLKHSTSNPSSTPEGALNPGMLRQDVQKKKSSSNAEYNIINMIVQGETTVYRIPRTVEGFALLQKLAEKFPSNQVQQSDVKTTTLATTTTQTQTTSLITNPGTSAQWSAVSSIQNQSVTSIHKSPIPSVPNSSVISNVTSTSVQQAGTVHSNVTSASKSVTQPTEATTSHQVGNGAKVQQTLKTEVEPPKLLFLDSPNLQKPVVSKFTTIPTSSSISLTLNKLGSITGNKVSNKGPVPNQIRTNPHPITLPRSKSMYYTSPKSLSITNESASYTPQPSAELKNFSTSSTHIPQEELLMDLPEIPPDIPSDLTETSLAPLETIPEICDSLLESSHQIDTEDVSDFCVISNVFSLSDTAKAVTNLDN